ncbi:glycoside hydrolase family 3 N-terminal domain-containing protein [Paenibacillus sp. LHD-38]|uniref:glycoside hydrolase family 3 N-terminal domain-containing protein n=1 Tax=Paenibacillus sp. LHD-38 TaxID=3072143 RepID=UPI0028100F08|nr:glycoside hydrolase family 3 N-terminal domain-containing protein [Paenibacillus sp. LHD-38]MDQ8736792.1 glycoside hydrolase family 3 N-terminal domain-containing protein [Paenibacillus sp. LHD-38]
MNIKNKVKALLARMTLPEKVGQMTQLGTFNPTDDLSLIREGRVGSLLGVKGAETVNELQRIAVEQSRLGIPLLIAADVIHGYRSIFPIPLAEACSWNPALVEETAAIAAREASAEGIQWVLSPMVDITRDPRWGRIAEGAGEDPYLGSEMARARVKGIQRNDWNNRPYMMACPKHFAGYGFIEAGRDYNTVDMSIRRLREICFPPFQAAIEAGAGTIMVAFNELNGVPCAGNGWLLKEVLQQQWGFEGVVVSDWDSIGELVEHGYARSREEAARLAIESGVHMDMQSLVYHEHLLDLVRQGIVSELVIDDAVSRILSMKFQLGLFDRPYTDPALASTILLAPDHVQTARHMACESIVLLKNEGNVLPLKQTIRKLAVIGPLANDGDALLGCWSGQGRSSDVVTIVDGIHTAVNAGMEILYAKGCGTAEGTENEKTEAAAIASLCEVAIVVLGETANMSGENNNRTSLDLPSCQMSLLKAIHDTGTPVVLVLVNGRPLSVEWAQLHVPAIVETWQLGIQAGMATADVLFGHYNPSGKLPVTFPRNAGQIPIYYSAKKTGRPQMKHYVDANVEPLYPFGYGLSYTTFEYSNLVLSKPSISPQGSLKVQACIFNAGSMDGEEIVQLYICDEFASITRPVKELKGFWKIMLRAGETQTVEFELTAEHLGFVNNEQQFVVEPGSFRVWVGPNSTDGLEGKFEVDS